eukprot:COSAG05_NODE_15844_length_359_cov_1.307692_1_plen_89_part_10
MISGMMGGMGGMSGMGGPMGGMMGGGRGGNRGGRVSAPDNFDRLPRGTRVLVKGLVGAAHHNGKTGQIAAFDPQKNRYVVRLGHEEIAI